MHKLIVSLLLLTIAPYAKADDSLLCLKNVEVKISEIVPTTVHVTDTFARKNSISLRMPADCKTQVLLIPSTLAEAKDWLDLALPYDFKSGLVRSDDYFDAYVDTQYGSSVEHDLYVYFNNQWDLKTDSLICKEAPNIPHAKQGLNWCFYQLVNAIRADYKEPKTSPNR